MVHSAFDCCFFFSSRRRHTRWTGDWSSDVCSSDLSSHGPAVHSNADRGDGGGGGIARAGGAGRRARRRPRRSEERRVGKGVDLGGRRVIKKKRRVLE